MMAFSLGIIGKPHTGIGGPVCTPITTNARLGAGELGGDDKLPLLVDAAVLQPPQRGIHIGVEPVGPTQGQAHVHLGVHLVHILAAGA